MGVTCLNKARAEKAQDCKLWSPREMLLDLLNEINLGKVDPEQIVVHWIEKEDKDGRRLAHYAASGVSTPEHIALLSVALHNLIHWWTGKDE